MSEEKKIKCPQCGKTIAHETEKSIEIQCGGKHDGHKCKHITVIQKNS